MASEYGVLPTILCISEDKVVALVCAVTPNGVVALDEIDTEMLTSASNTAAERDFVFMIVLT